MIWTSMVFADFGIITDEFMARKGFAGPRRRTLLFAAARPPPRLSSRLASVPCVPLRSYVIGRIIESRFNGRFQIEKRKRRRICALSAHSLPNYLLLQEAPGGDLPREPAIRAEATIPGKNFRLRMTFRRNRRIRVGYVQFPAGVREWSRCL
ncbi:hypothetical protein NKI80_30140 [Mesorhizobium sp. M0387]